MTPDRWTLRSWGKAAYLFAVLCLVMAALLDRAAELARNKADGAVQRHEIQHHEDWSSNDEDE